MKEIIKAQVDFINLCAESLGYDFRYYIEGEEVMCVSDGGEEKVCSINPKGSIYLAERCAEYENEVVSSLG